MLKKGDLSVSESDRFFTYRPGLVASLVSFLN